MNKKLLWTAIGLLVLNVPATANASDVEVCVEGPFETEEESSSSGVCVDSGAVEELILSGGASSTEASISYSFTRTGLTCSVTWTTQVKGTSSSTTYSYEHGKTAPLADTLGAVGRQGSFTSTKGPISETLVKGVTIAWMAKIVNDNDSRDFKDKTKSFTC